MKVKKRKGKAGKGAQNGAKRKNEGMTGDDKEVSKKRKKSLEDRVDGPSESDKLLPRTLEERMASRRVVVVLEKAALELVQLKHGAVELMNADDHKGIMAKSNRDIGEARPDITHQCLMALLDSPLNKAGKLVIYIHTAQHVLIEVHPSLRIPRTFKRFAGLMVELLQRYRIRAAQANETLMKVISNPVEKYFPTGSKKFGFSVSGRPVRLRDFVNDFKSPNELNAPQTPLVFAIGAVAHCDPVNEERFGGCYVDDKLQICPWGLSAAYCCGKLCNEFENLWDIC
eukprot:gnl/MRDRNA2_/MRDRNA2_15596_c0_seq1.p1 gnl/MRDRNA2_/MRDRNA2_15596_c0~~gnl/MRDRNA2_/MRDRNA2_15596_c0_seq1.p1  ORF type:complete len:285 (-),score=74.89 gnl/MRDRNA2_/MRDRNA2_15596_c0_seq1:18-872(-)